MENLLELIEETKEKLFLIDMIDHWTSEDRESYEKLQKKLKELEKKLNGREQD